MSAAVLKTVGLLSLVSSAAAHPGVGRRHVHAEEARSYGFTTHMPIPTGALSSASLAAQASSQGPYKMGNVTAAGYGSGLPYTTTKNIYDSQSVTQASGVSALAVGTGADTCGPATVTVTATNKVTVTVPAGGSSPVSAPSSSSSTASLVSAAAFQPSGSGYGSKSAAQTTAQTTTAAQVSTAPGSSSVVAAASSSVSAPASSVSAAAQSTTAASAASSAASSSASPSSSAVSSSGKKGMGYNDASLLSNCKTSPGDWIFNWGFEEGSVSVEGVEYMPMCKTPDTSASDWSKFVASSSATSFMLFNECDIPSQCNRSPANISGLWDSYAQPIKQKGGKIIGPSVSNSNLAGQGLEWFKSFRSGCSSWNEICSYHFYWDATADAASTFNKTLVEDVKPLCPNGVYIPEFGLNNGDDATRAQFITDSVKFLDQLDFVLGYAPLFCAEGYLLNNGALSNQGTAYAAVS